MNKISFSQLWGRYRRRKSTMGIISDFVFLMIVIALFIPTTRQFLSTAIIKLGLFQPKTTQEIIYLKTSDLNWSITPLHGTENITLRFPSQKPILINFWATWCPPCLAELPALQRLYDEYGDKVDFYFISDEEPQKLSTFMEKKGYTLPVYTLRGQVEGQLYSRSIPTTFLLAPNGRIVMNKTGAAKWDGNKVKKTINNYLKNK